MNGKDAVVTIVAGIIGGAIAFAVWPPLCILGMISAGGIAWFGVQWDVTRTQIRPAMQAAGKFIPEAAETIWRGIGSLDGITKVTAPIAMYCIYQWVSWVFRQTVVELNVFSAIPTIVLLLILGSAAVASPFLLGHIMILALSEAAALKRGMAFWPRREKVPEHSTIAADNFYNHWLVRRKFVHKGNMPIPLPNTLRNRYKYAALRIWDGVVYLCYSMWIELWHSILKAIATVKNSLLWLKTFVASLAISIISSERNIAGASSFLGVMVGYSVLGGYAPTFTAHLLGSLLCGASSGVVLYGLHRLGQRRFPEIYRKLQKV